MIARRSLLVAATAGAAVPALHIHRAEEHPDAALLALCARLADLQAEWQRLYDATSDDNADTPADRAFDAYSFDVWPGLGFSTWKPEVRHPADLVGLLLTHPATTLEGVQAKAAAILAVDEASDYLGSPHHLSKTAR